MRDKQRVYAPILLIITSATIATADEGQNATKGVLETYNNGSKLERIVAIWNRSSHASNIHREDSGFAPNFATEVSECIEERPYQITENISQGKAVILNCFKTTLMLNVMKYLGESSKSNIKLLDGFLEFARIPGDCEELSETAAEGGDCMNKYSRHFGRDKRNRYAWMYKKAMLKLVSERNRLNAYRNQTEREREELMNRINENSEAFLAEVMRSMGNEEAEKTEEENLRMEMADPNLLALLDELSKDYMLKLRFYPGMAARMMRNHKGGFTFDLELDDPSEESDDKEEEEEEEEKEKVSSEEESTREIKDRPHYSDYDDEDDSSSYDTKRRGKGDKNKKKKKKKKEVKKLKKIVPYLLIPILIQLTLLPFVFKKLFFLAMKALFAGKMALILVGFNVLRNTYVKNDDDHVQKIRVEHYGYRRGEEYGAWINGRSLQESLIGSALAGNFFSGPNGVKS